MESLELTVYGMILLSLLEKYFKSSKTGLEVMNCGNKSKGNHSTVQHSLLVAIGI